MEKLTVSPLTFNCWLLFFLATAAHGTADLTLLRVQENLSNNTLVGTFSTNPVNIYWTAADKKLIEKMFKINTTAGTVRTRVPLDREEHSSYEFTVLAMTKQFTVKIEVLDVNDNDPVFHPNFLSKRLSETASDMKIPLGSVSDNDIGKNSISGCEIVSGNTDNVFRLITKVTNQRLLLDLAVNRKLDYERTPFYSLVLRAFDGGDKPRSSYLTLNISIIDSNDNYPMFPMSLYNATVMENATVRTSILRVSATDSDSGENGKIRFSIDHKSDLEEHFAIHPVTGVISLQKPVDYESRKVYDLIVIATDNGSEPLASQAAVSISVLNINEHPPDIHLTFLTGNETVGRISEGAKPGDYVARISVSDPDAALQADGNVNINISLIGGDGRFNLTTKDSIVYLVLVQMPLDRELKPFYNLTVIARDSGSPPLESRLSFLLRVDDINDNKPNFTRAVYHAEVQESVQKGVSVIQVHAEDKDEGNNSTITYSILHTPETNSNWFTINSRNGLITTNAKVDCETNSQPRITVQAVDGGIPPMSATALVIVTIRDINDNQPSFTHSYYNVSIPENSTVNTCILTVSASDPDCGFDSKVTYTIADGMGYKKPTEFYIERNSGRICVAKRLDYEKKSVFEFPIRADDRDGFYMTAIVKVSLEDVNDNPPEFYPLEYSTNLDKDTLPRVPIITVQATDKDSAKSYGIIGYSFLSGNEAGYFRIHLRSGVISLSKLLPNAPRLFQLQVTARDGGGLYAVKPANVTISVNDRNVPIPTFSESKYSFSVSEIDKPDTMVGRVRATIANSAHAITYSIISGDRQNLFQINTLTGVITVDNPLDHDTVPSVLLNIQAASGSPAVYGTSQVNITITDVNDNAPQFLGSNLSISVREDKTTISPFYSVVAKDLDSGLNGEIVYTLVNDKSGLFWIDRDRGDLHIRRKLDYERQNNYTLKIAAQDLGNPPQSTELLVFVNVLDVNDNSPSFDRKLYEMSVTETNSGPRTFGQVLATDADSGANGQITYSLKETPQSAKFGIYPNNSLLYVRDKIDREQQDMYYLTVIATDNGFPQFSASADVRVRVLDDNDNDPIFSRKRYTFNILENQSVGTVVGIVSATDRDSGQNAKLNYSIRSHSSEFAINPFLGEVTLRRVLDHETKTHYSIIVEVSDQGQPPRKASAMVDINVLDVNDNAPRFTSKKNAVVLENKAKGTPVLQVVATDPDAKENGSITYFFDTVGDQNAIANFAIHPRNGQITTREVLDYESQNKYILTVVAQDSGAVPMESRQQVEIRVIDDKDERPLFPSKNISFSIPENVPIRTSVGRIDAQYGDTESGRYNYYLVGGNIFGAFTIDVSSGEIYTVKDVDFEEASSHPLGVKIVYNGPYSVMSSNITVIINVIDVNDNAPMFDTDPVELSVQENTPVGTSLYTFAATDFDSGSNGSIVYSIRSSGSPGSEMFSIDARTGQLTVNKTVDYEKIQATSFIVVAEDQSPDLNSRLSSSITVLVTIEDENDNKPKINNSMLINVSEDESIGFPLIQLIAVDADSGNSSNGIVTYSIVSGNSKSTFLLDENTGLLTLAQKLDRETQDKYALNISSQDQGTPQHVSSTLLTIQVIDVNDNTPKFERSLYHAEIAENTRKNTNIVRIMAQDEDTGANGRIRYLIPQGTADNMFSIDEDSGVIKTTAKLDREYKMTYQITAYAVDDGYPMRYDTTNVVITVKDINDHSPVFKSSVYHLKIPENQRYNVIRTFVAYDADENENGKVTYRIEAGNTDQKFAVDPDTGKLSCEPLDREKVPFYNLTLVAEDAGNPQRIGRTHVLVAVLDLNDNQPVFEQSNYSRMLPEDIPPGTFVLQVSATDADQGANKNISYSLGNNTFGLFTLNSTNGTISTIGYFDREVRSTYQFDVIATDGSLYESPHSVSVPVQIVMDDVNDNRPVFPAQPYRVTISSQLGSDKFVLKVEATDRDAGRNQQVSYSFGSRSDDLAQRLFRINSRTGIIKTKVQMTYDKSGYYFLEVIARDNGGPLLSSAGVVEIMVGPHKHQQNLLFNASVYEISVPENAPKGRHVQTVTALYENRKLTSTRYEFISGNEDKTFFIDDQSGDIIIKRPENLNYEKASTLRLMVMAQVSGSRAYTTVNVNLIDVNDHTPIFTQSQYVSFVWENENRDTYVTKVSASDYDANNQVRYSIINGNDGRAFKVEQYSGIIKTTNLYLDREIYSSYQLDIEAADNGSPPKSSTCVLHITVVDKNDNNPVLPTPLPVNIGEGTEVGSVIAMVTANVADLNPAFSYNISSAEDMFNIDHLTGEVTLAQPLDYENRKQYFPNITVKSGNNYATTTLTVNVLDENDNAPEFNKQSYQVTVKETAYIGKSIITVTATDLDSGKNAEITYRMDIPVPEFYIDSRSGTIHVNRSLKFNPNHSIIQLVVVAEDAGNPRLSAVVVVYVQIIAVNTYPPRFLNTSYRVRFDENTARGTELLDLIGPTDSNSLKKRKVDYKIKEENMRDIFSLGRRSGVIRLNSMLDREKTDRYSFTVVASDDGTPQKTSTAHVEIIVEDVNDQPPVFNQHTYIAMLNESFLSNVTLITVHATDGDKGANSEIEYHITTGNENGLFTIDRTSGNIVITPGKHLDYEKASSHKLVVEAIDCINCQWSQRLSAFCIVIVNVTDINETPPLFPLQRYIEFVAENQPVNTRVFQAHANDKDGTLFGKVVYQIYDGDYKSFHIDRETGLVRTATRFDYEKRSQYTFQLKAMDSGGLHSVIPVEVNILSMDEYTPKFLKSKYSFSIRGDADAGEYVGEVEATDKDQGEDGRIIYRLGGTDDRFMISPLNGSIYVRENLRGGGSGSEASLRKRREVSTDNQDQKESPKENKEEKYEDVKLVVIAGSGKSDSKINETHAIIKIDRGCVGCDKLAIVDPGSGGKTLVIIIVVIVLSLILIIACILLFFVYRRRYRKRKPRSVPPSFEVPPSAAPRRPGPPSYREVVRCNGNHIAPSEVLSDRSGNSASSGRGSVEEDEDEEIRMINSNTCLQAQTLSRKVKMPDSGIQQDEDSCSDPPIQNHQEYFAKLGIDTSRIQAKTKPIATAPPLESLHHFPDDGGGDPEEIDINNIVYEKLGDIETDDELSMIENCRDQGFHDAEPHQVASLSSVVNSEEEYSGSYNWDYLLDWGPQYMPLADVFAEIAQLKDDDTLNCMPKKQPIHTVPQRFVNSTLNSNIRTVPPPIITDAPPKTYNQGSNHSSHTAANGPSGNPGSRTNNASLPTLPRSPISHESCFPSPALTPSFTPSLSPLATRSPSISPVVSSRGAGSSAHNTPGRARTSVKRGHPSYIGSPESEQEIRI